MGFFKDLFENPARALTAIGTFGTSEVVRAAGAKKAAQSIEAVYGGTATGIGVGFLSGGPAGAVVGGASGFGRGVAGALHGDEGQDIVGGAAKYAAITGGVAGAIKGTGAAGFVRNAVFKGAPTLSAPKAGFSFKETLGTAGILGFLSKGLEKAGPQLIEAAGRGVESLPSQIQAPAEKLVTYLQNPGASLPSVPLPSPAAATAPVVIDAQTVPEKNYTLWILALIAALAYFYLKRKNERS